MPTVKQLQSELRRYGLDTKGRKAQLEQRLKEHLAQQAAEAEAEAEAEPEATVHEEEPPAAVASTDAAIETPEAAAAAGQETVATDEGSVAAADDAMEVEQDPAPPTAQATQTTTPAEEAQHVPDVPTVDPFEGVDPAALASAQAKVVASMSQAELWDWNPVDPPPALVTNRIEYLKRSALGVELTLKELAA